MPQTMRTGILRTLAGALVVVMGMAACAGNGTGESATGDATSGQGAGQPSEGGTLVIGLETEPPGLDPATDSIGMAGRIISAALFDTLMAVGEEGDFLPFMAESLEHDESLTEWTAKLREDITFHDGTPLDAQAVKDNLDRQFETRVTFENVDKIEAIDDYTVKITTKIPWSAFPDVLASQLGYIGSPTAIEDLGEDRFGDEPVGSGPYKLEEWVRGDHLTVVRNEDYWRDDVPYADEIEFKPIPDQDARMAALRAGDIDIGLFSGGGLAQLQAEGQFATRTIPTGIFGLALNTEKPHLEDARVRRALAHALNREALIDVVWKGQGEAWNSPVAPDSPYAVDVQFPEHNPEQAEQLLDEYVADTGESVSLNIDWASNTQNLELVQLVKSQWEEVGVAVEIGSPMDSATYNEFVFEHNHEVAPYELFQNIDPDLWLFAWWQSDSFLNLPRFKSERIDELLVQGRSSIDESVRASAYQEVQEINAEELPWLFIKPALSGAGYQVHVGGVGEWRLPDGTPSVGQESRVTIMPDSLWVAN